MQEIIQFCLDNLNYWTVTLFMAVESSFIPFPSEVVVPPAAWLACNPDNGMNIVLVVIFATIGADIGALVNYYLALYLGRAVIYKLADSKFGHLCLLSGEKIAHSEEYFRRHGVPSTFFGRLVPGVRQLISIPAGLARMDIRKFLLFTTLGAGLWNSVLAFLGYLIHLSAPELKTAADVADKASEYSHEIGYVILAIVAVVIVYLVVKAYLKKRRKSA
ncbi:MAG: DedA family protein [Bacteroidales bacterium]|nr:DedA family protein [Bacteroidales bacterium]